MNDAKELLKITNETIELSREVVKVLRNNNDSLKEAKKLSQGYEGLRKRIG